MKNRTLPIAIAVALSVAVGTTVAVVHSHQTGNPTDTVGRHSSSETDSLSEPSRDRLDTSNSELEPTTPDSPNPSPTPHSSIPEAQRRPIEVSDQIADDSAFAEFRSNLAQAVRDRDVAFITQLVTEEGVGIGFGLPQTLEDLNLSNPDAWFWGVLEKALAVGCESGQNSYYENADNGEIWTCPNTTLAFYRQYPPPQNPQGIEYEFANVMVIGQNINVRARPTLNSPVIGVLSNEVVESNPTGWQEMQANVPEADWEQLTHPTQGWRPIVLPDGQEGYISNRYAYAPLDPRVIFGQVNGEWKIIYVEAGD